MGMTAETKHTNAAFLDGKSSAIIPVDATT
jgi:hypothetical protein